MCRIYMKKKTLPRVMFDFTNDVRLPYRKTLNLKFQNINWIPFRDPRFQGFVPNYDIT
jgi:hypothetical protein